MMAKAIKKKCSLYTYLDSIKVLEKGSKEDIALARKNYWKEYKAEWRKKQQRENKQYIVVLTLSDAKYISDIAKKHRRSVTSFIKASSFAYVRQQFVIPDVVAVNSIRELLMMNYSGLKTLFEESIIPYQDGKTILKQYEELEQTILYHLYYPESLEKRIADTLRQNPEYKDTISQILKNT